MDGRSVDITQLLEEDDSNVNKLMPHDYVREEDVFITEYVTPHHFISGVVKQRLGLIYPHLSFLFSAWMSYLLPLSCCHSA